MLVITEDPRVLSQKQRHHGPGAGIGQWREGVKGVIV